MRVADVPRRVPPAKYRTVMLFRIERQARVLFGEENSPARPAIAIGAAPPRAPEVEQLIDHRAFAIPRCPRMRRAGLRIAGEVIETARSSGPGALGRFGRSYQVRSRPAPTSAS